jgi:CBS-domain-containing membrane protein
MTRRDEFFDAMVRQLGVAYYQALHGGASAADVDQAVSQVAEAAEEAHGRAGRGGKVSSPRRSGRWRVSDVMTTDVVSVGNHASYRQIAEMLHENRLTALPVLTPDGHVAGVVSEADLLRKQARRERPDSRPGWPLHPSARAKAEARTAEGLMTSPAVTITPDALLGTAARLMHSHRIKRLPVVNADGTLAGIVSRTDLLTPFLRPDAEIIAEATSVLTGILLADPETVTVTAHDGVVTLDGRLASEEQIRAAVRLTEEIDGVVAVSSNLAAPPPENWPSGGYRIPG